MSNHQIEVGPFGINTIRTKGATVLTGNTDNTGCGSVMYHLPLKGPEHLRDVLHEACDAVLRWQYPNQVDAAWLQGERKRLFRVSLQYVDDIGGLARGELIRTGALSCGVCGAKFTPTSPHVLAVNDLEMDGSPLSRKWHACCAECARNIDPDSLALSNHPQESLEGTES